MIITFLRNLIETRREHRGCSRHINLIVITLNHCCWLTFLNTRAANGTVACISGTKRILNEWLLFLVDISKITSFFKPRQIGGSHHPRLIVFSSLKIEIRFVKMSSRCKHLAPLIEKLKLRDIILITVLCDIIGPCRNRTYIASVITQDISREIHRLITIVLRKQEWRLIKQLLLRKQVLLLNRLYISGQRIFYFLNIIEATSVGGIQVLYLRSWGLKDARDLFLHPYLVANSIDIGQHLIILTLRQPQLLPQPFYFLHLLLLVLDQKLALRLPQMLVCF